MPNEPALRLGAFAVVLIVMAGAEALAPRRRRARPRLGRWAANLSLTAIDTLVVRIVAPIGVTGVALYAHRHGYGLLPRLIHWPLVEGLIGFAVLDLAVYAQHVAMHYVPGLWRMHRVHHTDEEIDVTTGVRFHPFEILVSFVLKALIVLALGIPAFGVLLFEVVLNASSMFNHANWRMPLALDAIARLLIVTPDMHRVHHSVHFSEQNANFGFNFAWWDRLFKTYVAVPAEGHEEMRIGVEGLRDPRTIGGLLRLPIEKLRN